MVWTVRGFVVRLPMALVTRTLRDAIAVKLIAAGQPYRVVAKVFRVGAAGLHKRIKDMPEATRRGLEDADLVDLL